MIHHKDYGDTCTPKVLLMGKFRYYILLSMRLRKCAMEFWGYWGNGIFFFWAEIMLKICCTERTRLWPTPLQLGTLTRTFTSPYTMVLSCRSGIQPRFLKQIKKNLGSFSLCLQIGTNRWVSGIIHLLKKATPYLWRKALVCSMEWRQGHCHHVFRCCALPGLVQQGCKYGLFPHDCACLSVTLHTSCSWTCGLKNSRCPLWMPTGAFLESVSSWPEPVSFFLFFFFSSWNITWELERKLILILPSTWHALLKSYK